MFLADKITPKLVATLRKEAGGLICACIPHHLAYLLRLPFLQDILIESSNKYPILRKLAEKRLIYDQRSSFSITINHRTTRTGIPDIDRARTLQALAVLARETEEMSTSTIISPSSRKSLEERFTREFQSPGHVFLLIGAPKLTQERQGHTELSLALARMATKKSFPVTVICEMLDEDTGRALTLEKARKWAERNGSIVILGKDIIEAYQAWLNQQDNDSNETNTGQKLLMEARTW